MNEHFTRDEITDLAYKHLGVFLADERWSDVKAMLEDAVAAIDKKREAQGAVGVVNVSNGYKGIPNIAVAWMQEVSHGAKLYTRSQAAPAVGAPDACVWTPDTDYETNVHHSACGEAWAFTDGGPKENNVRFCQSCGKTVVIASAQPQQKEG